MELLKELIPAATPVAILLNPANPISESLFRDAEAASRALGLRLLLLEAGKESELDAVFARLPQLRADALVIGADAFMSSRSVRLAALAATYLVPTISPLSRVRRLRRSDELRREQSGRIPSWQALMRAGF